jgi:hypothetical protein
MSHSASENGTKPAISENTPLLGSSTNEPVNDAEILNHEAHENGGPKPHHEKPLPKLQIFLLCYARIVEPIAFFGIFPFISEMIYKTGNIEQTDVGFYAGLIVCPRPPHSPLPILTYGAGINVLIHANDADDSMGSCCGSHWKEASPCFLPCWDGDRDGYLWPQQEYLADGAFQMLCWGLCGDYCVRLSPSSLDFDTRVGLTGSRTVRAMITENSTKETQARAFSVFAFSGNLGIFLGPMIGTFDLTMNIRSRADIGRRCTGRSSNADRRDFQAH